MSFDTRQSQRKRILDRIILAAQVAAVLYLATHALIAWRAHEIDGIASAILTFVFLGFGDLYWGLRWAYEGADLWLAAVALAAAAVCFTSWATRGMFNRWAMRFTADMLEDMGSELGRMRDEAETIDVEPIEGEKARDETSDADPPRSGTRPPE